MIARLTYVVFIALSMLATGLYAGVKSYKEVGGDIDGNLLSLIAAICASCGTGMIIGLSTPPFKILITWIIHG